MKIQQILEDFSNPPLELVAETLDLEITPLQLETVNWAEFPYKPDVSVQIAWNGNELFLRYQVKEQAVKAEIDENNGRVWTDSCVEFFLSPEGNDEYYNVEMNCIGNILFGFRKKGEEAIHASEDQIATIRRISSLGDEPFAERKEQTEWQITVAIPWEVFFKHTFKPEKGMKVRGNFYKCGDELSVPHFVSWTKIKTDKPSFHEPQFFGGLEFE
ncbi:MAG TPA: carbohydrate-binding family 9-like protein [Prolixibacteraceae bacterium]|nr:carbohydrate-binding family 9-like protein [Prolixibacteraceae bacterium]